MAAFRSQGRDRRSVKACHAEGRGRWSLPVAPGAAHPSHVAMGCNLWLHGLDEHPFATYVDVHQGVEPQPCELEKRRMGKTGLSG